MIKGMKQTLEGDIMVYLVPATNETLPAVLEQAKAMSIDLRGKAAVRVVPA